MGVLVTSRRGVGSNQYADKAAVPTVEDVSLARKVRDTHAAPPVETAASPWEGYTQLVDAYKGDPKMLADAQNRVISSMPDRRGIAVLRAGKLEAQGEAGGHARHVEVIHSMLQGEPAEGLDDAVNALAGPPLARAAQLHVVMSGDGSDPDGRSSRFEALVESAKAVRP